jgi:hypothetical protein
MMSVNEVTPSGVRSVSISASDFFGWGDIGSGGGSSSGSTGGTEGASGGNRGEGGFGSDTSSDK